MINLWGWDWDLLRSFHTGVNLSFSIGNGPPDRPGSGDCSIIFQVKRHGDYRFERSLPAPGTEGVVVIKLGVRKGVGYIEGHPEEFLDAEAFEAAIHRVLCAAEATLRLA